MVVDFERPSKELREVKFDKKARQFRGGVVVRQYDWYPCDTFRPTEGSRVYVKGARGSLTIAFYAAGWYRREDDGFPVSPVAFAYAEPDGKRVSRKRLFVGRRKD